MLTSYLGERYALNQNIPSNLLDAYLLVDFGASYSHLIKNNELTLRFSLNNITNKQYSYINYFVMPGIHFNVRLQYAL
ncbi:Vitamin B12 transporter BtuB [compost metagenome]